MLYSKLPVVTDLPGKTVLAFCRELSKDTQAAPKKVKKIKNDGFSAVNFFHLMLLLQSQNSQAPVYDQKYRCFHLTYPSLLA